MFYSLIYIFLAFGVEEGHSTFTASAVLYRNGITTSESSIGDKYKTDGIVGMVNFSQEAKGAPVIISAEITLWPNNGNLAGGYGFHIHEYGNLGKSCTAAGNHYNPTNKTHGAPSDATRHVGDLGNLIRNGNSGLVVFNDSVIDLTGNQSIIGRAVVIHMTTDDLGKMVNDSASLMTGNAGGRFACGVIGITSDFSPANKAESFLSFKDKSIFLLSVCFCTFTLSLGH